MPIIAALKSPAAKGFRAVIVSPTRELAAQIKREFDRLAEGSKLQVRTRACVCISPKSLMLNLDDENTASMPAWSACRTPTVGASLTCSHHPTAFAHGTHISRANRCGCWTRAQHLPTRLEKGLQ